MSEYSEPMKFIDLDAQQSNIKDELLLAVKNVLEHGNYIMGPEVKKIEKLLTDFTCAKKALS